MELNADFSRRVVIRPEDYHWRTSPAAGVDRMMLDRIGDEVARATTIVRFAPNTTFEAHTHGGGEEFLVLDGVFSDEHAHYPAGTYVRNPIGTFHRPYIGPEGATILVKLCQFDKTDTEQKAIHPQKAAFRPGQAQGVSELLLHDVASETVRLVRIDAGAQFAQAAAPVAEEVFVIEGSYTDDDGHYPAGTWLRRPDVPAGRVSSETGVLLYVKTGHLGPLVKGAQASA